MHLRVKLGVFRCRCRCVSVCVCASVRDPSSNSNPDPHCCLQPWPEKMSEDLVGVGACVKHACTHACVEPSCNSDPDPSPGPSGEAVVVRQRPQ